MSGGPDILKAAPSATITSANLPKPPVETKVEVDADTPIVAKSLVNSDFTNIKPKNPLLSLYWGNRIANQGLRIEDLKARGFRVAKPEEVHMPDGKGGFVPIGPSMLKDGHVQRGDLICLLISKVDYQGQLMHNEQTAQQRVSKASVAAEGRKNLGDAFREVGGLPQRYRGKVGVYNPDAADIKS